MRRYFLPLTGQTGLPDTRIDKTLEFQSVKNYLTKPNVSNLIAIAVMETLKR